MKTLKRNVLAIPFLIWFGLLVGIPLVYVVVLSFMSRDHLGNVVFRFTLENYQKVFDPIYLRVFANSFLLALLTGFITLLIGYPVAYITSQLEPKKRNLAIALFMLPSGFLVYLELMAG